MSISVFCVCVYAFACLSVCMVVVQLVGQWYYTSEEGPLLPPASLAPTYGPTTSSITIIIVNEGVRVSIF